MGPSRVTGTVTGVTDDDWLDVLTEATERVRTEVDRYDDMRRGGERPDQYGFDMVADAVVLDTLTPTGAGTFSEESGLRAGTTGDVVVIDPVDGSTNASYGIPHYACSLAVRDAEGIRVGLVTNLATGERFEAVRGRGSLRNGEPVKPTGCERLSDAVVAITGHPNRPIGWAQFRALGACALDVSYVASGVLDAFVDPITQLGLWDYAAAHVIALEAGVVVGEVSGLDVLHGDHSARRGVIYAATPALLAELEAAFAAPDDTDKPDRAEGSGGSLGFAAPDDTGRSDRAEGSGVST